MKDASQLSWSMLACNVIGLGCTPAYGFTSVFYNLVLSVLKMRYMGDTADGERPEDYPRTL